MFSENAITITVSSLLETQHTLYKLHMCLTSCGKRGIKKILDVSREKLLFELGIKPWTCSSLD